MNWGIQFVFFINVSWLTSVCKWATLICSPCSRVILYFSPWLKRTFLMWHPPSAHINTHAFRIQPNPKTCARPPPPPHPPRAHADNTHSATDSNSICTCLLKGRKIEPKRTRRRRSRGGNCYCVWNIRNTCRTKVCVLTGWLKEMFVDTLSLCPTVFIMLCHGRRRAADIHSVLLLTPYWCCF